MAMRVHIARFWITLLKPVRRVLNNGINYHLEVQMCAFMEDLSDFLEIIEPFTAIDETPLSKKLDRVKAELTRHTLQFTRPYIARRMWWSIKLRAVEKCG